MEDFMIAMGKFLNTFSGISNAAVNMIFRASVETSYDASLVEVVSDNADKKTGKQLAHFIKKFLNFQVPGATSVYGGSSSQ
jgi:hypothetical protein